MLYSSEVWPLKESDITRISGTDMQMVRWMRNLPDRKSPTSLRNRLDVTNVMSNNAEMV